MSERTFDIEVLSKAEVVPPDYIDGKYIKECQCGCGNEFEVPSRSVGIMKYRQECSAAIHKAQQVARTRGKTCIRCGDIKDRDLFWPGRGRLCKECWPFELTWDRFAPACFKVKTEIKLRKGHKYKVQHSELCPLYANCAKRRRRKLWVPCAAPNNGDLVFIMGLPPAEFEAARELVVPGFASDAKTVVDRGLEYWLGQLEDKYNADV